VENLWKKRVSVLENENPTNTYAVFHKLTALMMAAGKEI
jgi:hypothetical protein